MSQVGSHLPPQFPAHLVEAFWDEVRAALVRDGTAPRTADELIRQYRERLAARPGSEMWAYHDGPERVADELAKLLT